MFYLFYVTMIEILPKVVNKIKKFFFLFAQKSTKKNLSLEPVTILKSFRRLKCMCQDFF